MPNLKTRRRTGHFCLGQPAPLPQKYLPTEAEVYNATVHKRQELNLHSNNFSNSLLPKSVIYKEIAHELISLWVGQGNLPTLSEQSVILKIQKLCDRAKAILKVPEARRLKLLHDLENAEEFNEAHAQKKEKTVDFFHNLFDICPCKCLIRSTCKCPKDKKVPVLEWDFLWDQRSDRDRFIGEVDQEVTEKWTENQDRNDNEDFRITKEENRCNNVREARKENVKAFFQFENDENHNNTEAGDDEEYTPAGPQISILADTSQNRLDLSNFIAEVDRYQISDRAAAALSTGLLRDLGIVTDKDLSNVVDKFKIRRARVKRQKERKRKRKDETSGKVTCLGFDGKKDKKTKTLIDTEVAGKTVTKQGFAAEEHIVFVNEPEGRYLDHIVVEPGKGTGRDVGQAVSDLVREYDSADTIQAVCADGTAVNTGYKSGAIAEAERNLGKPLQWLICLKHCNELPLRHVFDELDGGFGTSGPTSFKGELGQEVAGDVHKADVIKFEKIDSTLSDIPDDVSGSLSRDQKLLYRYAKAIMHGTVPDNLKDQKPGPLCHARLGHVIKMKSEF